jgi:hypothetical protein
MIQSLTYTCINITLIFWLKANIRNVMEFEDIDQVEAACQEFFNSKEPIFYRRGIELLGQRWLEVVDNNGEYLV